MVTATATTMTTTLLWIWNKMPINCDYGEMVGESDDFLINLCKQWKCSDDIKSLKNRSTEWEPTHVQIINCSLILSLFLCLAVCQQPVLSRKIRTQEIIAFISELVKCWIFHKNMRLEMFATRTISPTHMHTHTTEYYVLKYIVIKSILNFI